MTAPVEAATDLYPTPDLAAPMLASLGYRVVPALDGKKRPALNDWPNVATTDPSTIAGWDWSGGVCVVTGEASDLVVLDVDVKDGAPGRDTLKALVAAHERTGKLPETPVADTPSGGLHYWYRWPKGRKIRNDAGRKLGPGLDIRADGGQVVAPPTTRPGGAYRWHVGRAVWDVDPADMPAWMVARTAEPDTAPPAPNMADLERVRNDSRPACVDAYNRDRSWNSLLEPDGWTLADTDRYGAQYWCRPGKTPREGPSATVNHAGLDCLYVFSTNAPGYLPIEKSMDKFGYMARRDFAGDFAAAVRAFKPETGSHAAGIALPNGNAPAPTGDPPSDGPGGPTPVDWAAFWKNEPAETEFVIEPLFARGRQTAIFSAAKTGKSLLVLDMVAAAVTGRSVLGMPAKAPIRVVYVDMEMTEADLRERLEDLGYGPDDHLGGLAYYQLCDLPPMDTDAGGIVLLQIVTAHRADLVILDTMARVVDGDEANSDTYRAFYRHTGARLKAAQVALGRLDHMGKEQAKGQRGSSAKADDVDAVYRLTAADRNCLMLNRTHTRVPWMPAVVNVSRIEEPCLRHVMADELWPAGTAEVAAALDDLGVPIDATQRTAMNALKAADGGRRTVVVAAALKHRRARKVIPESLTTGGVSE